MAQGGYRPGSGRKKGQKASHTIVAETARKELVGRVSDEIKPIVEALIRRAKRGDVRAAHLLFERAFGRVQPIEPMIESFSPTIIMYGEDDHLKKVMEKRNKKVTLQ